MPVHTVFSVDDSLYLRWQAELLAYSHAKVGQPGPLTRLYSARSTPPPFAGQTFITEPFSPHPRTNDDYPIYNKVGALASWVTLSPPAEESLLVLDPDCIFLTPFDEPAERGRPLAQFIHYMNPRHPRHVELIKRHGYKPELVQAIGIPLLLHRDDAKELFPLWMEKTEAIRDDPMSCELAGWIADMWGYAFAAADLGLRHQLRRLCRWEIEDVADLPIIHYCYESKNAHGDWEWDKRTYQPWQPVAEPPYDTPMAGATLISLLNELAAKQTSTPRSSAADAAR